MFIWGSSPELVEFADRQLMMLVAMRKLEPEQRAGVNPGRHGSRGLIWLDCRWATEYVVRAAQYKGRKQ